MSSIKEVNQFVTAIQVRKISQQTLAPLINSIQQQIQKLKRQTYQLRKQSQKIIQFQRVQQNSQATLRQFNSKLVQFKAQVIELKNSDARNLLACNKNYEKNKEDISSLMRQLRYKDDKIKQNMNKSLQIERRIQKLQDATQSSIESVRKRLNQVHSTTMQQIRKSSQIFKKNNEALESTRREIQNDRIRYRESSNVISLYLSEKQELNRKLNQGLDKIINCATIHQFYELQQKIKHQVKVVQRAQDTIKNLPTKNDLSQLSIIVRNVEQKVADFAKIIQLQLEVDQIKRQIDQKEAQKNGKYTNMQILLNKIQEKLQEMKSKRIDDFTQRQKSESQKLKEYLLSQIRSLGDQFDGKLDLASQQSQKLFANMLLKKSEELSAKQKKLKQQMKSDIQQMTERVDKRCLKIQTLGSNLQQQLLVFGNRITRMRGDNEIFKEAMTKQYKQLLKNKLQINERMQQIGKIISSILQIVSITNSLNLYESSNNLTQKLVYVTYSDGIICQIQRQSTNQLQFFYRKKILNPYELKKSIMTGIIQLIDEVIQSYTFLNINEYKPSFFFLNNIINHYNIHLGKINQKHEAQLKLSHHHLNQDITYSTLEKDYDSNNHDLPKEKISNPKYNNHTTLQSKKYTIKVTKHHKNETLFQNRISTARSGRYQRMKMMSDI